MVANCNPDDTWRVPNPNPIHAMSVSYSLATVGLGLSLFFSRPDTENYSVTAATMAPYRDTTCRAVPCHAGCERRIQQSLFSVHGAPRDRHTACVYVYDAYHNCRPWRLTKKYLKRQKSLHEYTNDICDVNADTCVANAISVHVAFREKWWTVSKINNFVQFLRPNSAA